MIARDVPAGMGRGHERDEDMVVMPPLPATAVAGADWWTDRLVTKAPQQFGSLGSGNHFVEICLDEADRVWIVLHSGSRGVGNILANVHIDGAKAEMEQLAVELPDRDLAYLTEGTPEFDAYICDMRWSQEYAMGNRQRMLALVHAATARFLGRERGELTSSTRSTATTTSPSASRTTSTASRPRCG
jgi:RNA-splicing ligase RtcB